MVLNLRVVAPSFRADHVVAALLDDPRVTDVVRLPGAGLRPAGDLVSCDVTREALSDLLGWLEREGLFTDGSIVVSEISSAPSANARAAEHAEHAAPGSPDDAIVGATVVDNAYGEVRGCWSF